MKDRCSAFLRCGANAGVTRLPYLQENDLCHYDWAEECLRNSAQDAVDLTDFKHPVLPTIDIWELTGGRRMQASKERSAFEWTVIPFFFSKQLCDTLVEKLSTGRRWRALVSLIWNDRQPRRLAP